MVHGGDEGIVQNCQVMPCCRADTGDQCPSPGRYEPFSRVLTRWTYDLEKGVGRLDWVKHIQCRKRTTEHDKLGTSRIPTFPPRIKNTTKHGIQRVVCAIEMTGELEELGVPVCPCLPEQPCLDNLENTSSGIN